jgi:hypothetical protein
MVPTLFLHSTRWWGAVAAQTAAPMLLALLLALWCAPRPAAAQTGTALPIAVEVRVLGEALGLGRQRLALVVGLSRIGGFDMPAVRRDAAAVAEALRRAGFLVLARPDIGVEDLRRSVAEFRRRLEPAGAGLIYVAGAGAQVDGRSWLLTRSLAAAAGRDMAPSAEAMKAASLDVDELVQALQITPSSLRLLVVDAASPLPGLPAAWRGLQAPKLPDGVMALLAAQPGAASPVWLPPPLPTPPPTDPREATGSPFGTAFVHSLLASGHSGPAVLQQTRRLALDATEGLVNPWVGGRSDERDELGAPTLPIAQWPEAAAAKAMRTLAGAALDEWRRQPRPVQAPATAPAAPPLADGSPLLPDAGTAAAVAAATAGAVAAAGATATAAQQSMTETAAAQAVSAVRNVVPTAGGDGEKALVDNLPAAAPTVGPPAAPASVKPTPAAAAAPLPALNPFGYAAGDRFTYRRIDEWKGEAIGLIVQVIDQLLDNGDLQAREGDDRQTLDAQGRVRSRSGPSGHSSFEPVEEFWWTRPQKGQSRDVEFMETFEQSDGHGQRRWEGEVEVGRPTRIETAAGSFDVLPLEGSGWYREWRMPQRTRRDVRWSRTVWYAPDLGRPVAIDILERDAGSRLLRRERIELIEAQTSRSVAR